MDITGEAWDGQLPKLDIILLAHNAFYNHGNTRLKLAGPDGFQPPGMLLKWWESLAAALSSEQLAYVHKTARMLAMVARQANGQPTGAHAPFKSFFVDAVTVRTTPGKVCATLPAHAVCALFRQDSSS